MGRGKKGSEAPAFFLFPSSPARLLFFSMIVPFFFVGGIGGGGGGCTQRDPLRRREAHYL